MQRTVEFLGDMLSMNPTAHDFICDRLVTEKITSNNLLKYKHGSSFRKL